MQEEIIQYIKNVIAFRLVTEFDKEKEPEFPFFNFEKRDTLFSNFVIENKLALPEVIVLLIALLPHTVPGYLNDILSEYHPNGSDFLEFGGSKGTNYRGIIPTGETALYVIGGTNLEKRNIIARIFDEDHIFHRKNILSLGNVDLGEPKLSGKLLLDQEYIDLFLYGSISKPKSGADFPATLIETELNWDDLVLSENTIDKVNDILVWLKYNDTLMEDWGMKHKIKPGYRVLLYGPPGTGKTLTANLLGKQMGMDVYRIDLSLVVSKFIGETEKNLAKLFDKAEHKNWILFIDEADSIVGKRTEVRDAHDKYANQEVSYLLQRMESHPGLIILATNYKSNIDKAFTRRFQSFIEFENPNYRERLLLWENYIPQHLVTSRLDLNDIAERYDVTGSNIVNIVQYACLKTLELGNDVLSNTILLNAIRREFEKEGRML